MNLKEKNCLPYRSEMKALTTEEKKNLKLSLNSGWQLTHEEQRLWRDFSFKNFKQALEFANLVGAMAETQKHHPELHVGWKHCGVEVWTHVINGLLEADFILAAKADDIYQKYTST
jgi:4a-hydroxytetrahydrobiopterin dehydratase